MSLATEIAFSRKWNSALHVSNPREDSDVAEIHSVFENAKRHPLNYFTYRVKETHISFDNRSTDVIVILGCIRLASVSRGMERDIRSTKAGMGAGVYTVFEFRSTSSRSIKDKVRDTLTGVYSHVSVTKDRYIVYIRHVDGVRSISE